MSSDAPDPPDYRGAAQEEAEANKLLTTQQTWANRPSFQTPWGNLNWDVHTVIDPATNQPVNQWAGNVSLTPEQQAALASQQRIQSGRSGAAETLLGQATSAFQRPFDWSNVPAGADRISVPSLGPDRFNQEQYAAPVNREALFSLAPQAGDMNTRIQDRMTYGVDGSPLNMTAQNRLSYNVRALPMNMTAQDRMTYNVDGGDITMGLGASPSQYRDRAEAAVWERMQPDLQERRSATETQLLNMGLTRGSEAWNTEQRRLADAEDRARLTAIESGRAEAAQMFGQDLESGRFANQAQQQQFGQLMQSAVMGNETALKAMGFENAAQAQQFAQSMQSSQFRNDQIMRAMGFENQAQAQEFSQTLQSATLGNEAALKALGFENAAQAQQFAQQFQSTQFNNQAIMQGMQFENIAQQQQFENLMQLAQRGDQRAQAQVDMAIRAGTFNNLNRQQSISEQTLQRSQILNELNALLTGQQVANPAFPSYNPAGRSDAPQYLQAAGETYDANLNSFNAEQASQSSMMQGAATVASIAAMVF